MDRLGCIVGTPVTSFVQKIAGRWLAVLQVTFRPNLREMRFFARQTAPIAKSCDPIYFAARRQRRVRCRKLEMQGGVPGKHAPANVNTLIRITAATIKQSPFTGCIDEA